MGRVGARAASEGQPAGVRCREGCFQSRRGVVGVRRPQPVTPVTCPGHHTPALKPNSGMLAAHTAMQAF